MGLGLMTVLTTVWPASTEARTAPPPTSPAPGLASPPPELVPQSGSASAGAAARNGSPGHASTATASPMARPAAPAAEAPAPRTTAAAGGNVSSSPAPPPADLPDWPSLNQLLGLPPWLSLQLQGTAAPIANPIGGLRSAAGWMQLIELDLSAGTGLALGQGQGSAERGSELNHWQADLRFDLYSGSSGYGVSIGSLIPPQTIDYPTGLWLSGASLTRRSPDGRLRLSAGLLSLDEDFVVAPAYDAYLFAAINNTLNLNILGLPISPFMAPGATIRWQTGRVGEWRLGAYWLDPEIQLASLFGVDTSLPRVSGTLQSVQWLYQSAASRSHYGAPIVTTGGLTINRQLPPPLLHLGAFRSQVTAGSGNTFLFPQALPAPGRTAINRVMYGSLTLPARLPLGLDNRIWAAVQVGFDPSVNPTPVFLAGGWLCQGPSPQRPQDVLALGVARSGFSAPLLSDLNWQAVVELNYSLRLNANLSLQPLVQWILNPSGTGRVPGIITTGLQVTLNF